MVAKSLGRSLAVLLLCPPAAFALGLGDIHLKSSLNAPLDAEIDLVGATPEDLASLRAQVAPQEAFSRANLEWSKFLTTVTLRQVRSADGRDVIVLHSADSITEPFLTLLIQVTWARGQLLREYTVLLDPPVYTPGAQAATPVAAPVSGTTARQGQVERQDTSAAAPAAPPASLAPVTAPSPARQRTQGVSSAAPNASSAPVAASSASSADAAGGTYTVRRGDTLSKLASQYGATGQNRRWMVATYQNNASAFDGNINSLRSGAILRLPDAQAISGVSASAAAAEVSRQYAAWRQSNGTGAAGGAGSPSTAASATAPTNDNAHLRLVTPSERPGAGTAPTPSSASSASSTAAAAAAAAAKATAAADAKVHDLQAQLDESRRLLDLRNAELAQLQARLSSQAAAPAAAAPAPAPRAPAESVPPTPQAAAPAPAPTEAPPAAAAPPAATPPAATAAPAPAEDTGIVGLLKKFWWAVALLVVALAAILGLRSRRAREEQAFGDSLGRLAAAGSVAEVQHDQTGETTPLRQPVMPPDENFLVEESGAHARPTFADSFAREAAPEAPLPVPVPRNVTTDQTISSDTAINLDQGDPLAEADFHMAYGLYDQAADLIRMAIAREPDRRDLKLKLLEVFFVWGNKDQFLQMAHELAATRENAAPGEWEKIVIMGKQLAPEDALFSGDSTMHSSVASSVDINLDTGSRTGVDFDLLGEPIHELDRNGVDLDIGGAIGEPEPMRADAGEATDRNLALDSKLDMDFDDPGDAAPTVEQPNFGTLDNPTIRQKVEMALRQGSGIDQTAELAIDDLGLDIGALDTVDQPGLGAGPDAPTLVAGLDDRSRRIIENAEGRSDQETVVTSNSPTGPWQFGAEDEDDSADKTQQMPTGDESPTSRLAALKERDLDFDLDADSEAETGENALTTRAPNIDLDVGTAAVADSSYTETQQLGQDELALPNLEPVTMSEVGTKLDLARAYMDMGDPEGARNILDEVLQEGSVAQKQEAQRLLESLPG